MSKSYAQCSVCWCAGRAQWENLARLATCALICLMATIPYAFAGTEFPPDGGPGGGMFREDCPPGQYLVGARYRAGSWLDQISIICAPVDATGMTGQRWYGSMFGGNGGGPHEQSCNPGYIITGGGILVHSGSQVVHMMDLNCRSTTSTLRYALTNVGAPSSFFPEIYQHCPPGEAVIGIQGRSGAFVDAIGMICGATSAEFPPSRPEPLSEACQGLEADQVPEEWSDMLRAHNERRTEHCVAPLTWSNELAKAAQAYAEKCILNMHGSDGENMANAWAVMNKKPVLPALSNKEAFEKTWYCEARAYDFDNPQFKEGFATNCQDGSQDVNAHFTQVVWKDTCQLGCGRADCEIKDAQGVVHMGTHWVCRYKPPGNVNADNVSVLKQQVRRPQCGP
jgi:hypothetical protein